MIKIIKKFFTSKYSMSLVEEIRQNILDPDIRLSVIMRKAKVLAYRLNHQSFKQWVENELAGYLNVEKTQIPEYRRLIMESYGDFQSLFETRRNMPIATIQLRDVFKDFQKIEILEEILSRDWLCNLGIQYIEGLIKRDEIVYRLPWPNDFVDLLKFPQASDRLYPGYKCLLAWRTMSKEQMEQILDDVRNRLLDFVLELENGFPQIVSSDNAISSVSKESVTYFFNTMIIKGNNNIIANGDNISQTIHQQVIQNDLDSLLKFMKNINLSDSIISDLKNALEHDGHPTSQKKFGTRVREWFGSVSADIASGIILGNMDKIEHIKNALFAYFGWL